MDSYRILFFTSSLRGGGAENHLLNLCRYLKSLGHEPAVCTISPEEDGLEHVMLIDGIGLIRLPLRSLADLLSPAKIWTLRGIVKRFDPDIMHAHLFHGEVVAWVSSHFAGAPLVVTRHSTGLEFRGWRKVLARLMNSRLARVIAVSREAAVEAEGMGYRRENISLIPNAIDTRRFRPLGEEERENQRRLLLERYFPDAAADTPIIGSMGGLKPIKNFPLLIRLAVIFAGEGPLAAVPRFLMFGEGAERERLEKLSSDLGAKAFVALPGRRERPEEVYPLFDIFVLPSRSEGVPMALLEAMASAVPCVASDVGDIGEVISETGFTVSEGDEEGFAAAVRTLVENPPLRAELGRKARVRILELYDTDVWGDAILGIYRSLIGHQQPRV
jgi:glycosyltransferase involved in cell wall biosynthesis